MANQIRSTIQNFVASLHTYDYILFSASGALFLLILLLAVLFRKKAALSLSLVLISFVVIIAGPVSGYSYIHGKLYKTEISELLVKKLEFSQALLIKGELTNLGQLNFRKCTITSSAYKAPSNFFEEMLFPLRPFQNVSMVSEEELGLNQSLDFKLIMEPFTYSSEYNISVKAECI